jgi:hypothetical protein
MRRYVILLAGLGVAIPAHGQSGARAVSDSVLSTAVTLVAKREELARIWPGFWSGEPAFFLAVPEGAVVLVSTRTPGPEYTLTPAPPQHPELRDVLYTRLGPTGAGALRSGWWDMRHRSGDVSGTAIAMRETSKKSIEVLLHEAFHRYQLEVLQVVGANMPADSIYVDVVYNRLAELERVSLAAALADPVPIAIRERLSEYLAVRLHRERLFPHLARDERRVEIMEGTAQYVGLRAGAIAFPNDGSPHDEVLRDLLQPLRLQELMRYVDRPDPIVFRDATERMRWAHRTRLYATGAAIAFLLDVIREGWQDDVARGRTLPDVVMDAISSQTAVPWIDVDEVMRRYGRADIEARVRALLNAAGAQP